MPNYPHLSKLDPSTDHAMKTDKNDPSPIEKSADDELKNLILTASSRRINRLTSELGLDRYLEIGVEQGLTFLQVKCKEKTGVDPCFQFDWQQHHGKDGIGLHEVTSDSFFSQLPTKAQYDMIFVDGLHTFDQTYRDILHAMRHSHPGTVVLIDDTVPCDAFSTCRDQQQCMNLRQRFGNPQDIRWHGDTYKVVPLLSAFNPELRLLTLMDGGNPQTLLWKPPTSESEDPVRTMQAMWAVQNLAAADYIWFLDNISLYNPISEQEGLQQVIDSLAKA